MPKKARELSALEVGRLKTPGMHAVGGVAGLALQVVPSGGRTWVLRAVIAGKRREMGLGGFPDVTLAGAREKARAARLQIEQGVDPIERRQQARNLLMTESAASRTFDQCVAGLLEARQGEWTNAKHRWQWEQTLKLASEVMGKLRVTDINTAHVLDVLQPIWFTKNETASRLRGRIENVLDWASARGYRKGAENPARWRGHLDKLLTRPSKVAKVKHYAAVSIDAMASFLKALREIEGVSARALEFTIFTAARSGEVLGAKWSEVDLDERVWTVPAERMKAKKEHRVPLSPQAVKLVKALPRIEQQELIFQSPRGGQLSNMAMTRLMDRMGIDAVPHGFRSTFRDWASERTNYPSEMAEMALAHTIRNEVEAAYRRGDLLAKRAHMMAAWATFCEKPVESGKVAQLVAKAAN